MNQYPLLPIRDQVIFPYTMMTFFVGREKSVAAFELALSRQSEIVLATQKDAKVNEPLVEDLYNYGTLCSIIQVMKLPDGAIKIFVEGKSRVKLLDAAEVEGTVCVNVEPVSISDPAINSEIEALLRYVKSSFEKYVKLDNRIPPEVLMKVMEVESVDELGNIVASQLNIKLEDRQRILEIFEPKIQLEAVLELMLAEMEILEVEKKIKNRVKDQVEKSQKEYYLNEQMQAIQKELGEKDDMFVQVQEFLNVLKTKKMPDESRAKIEKEIKKLRTIPSMSAESSVVRNYVDWVLSLPWDRNKKSEYDLKKAQEILDADHWGLEKVKERIIEQLAVQALTKDNKSPVICLVGPPGVGKTSLARSVARALDRPFVKVSLGGLREESEIRGHRRTYVGAMPGRIIQNLKRSEYNNPVMLLDEIDKMSSDFRGDPASALLEVLDPEQNKHFSDHFLEVDYDLSNVLFFATANTLHTLPRPLLDRMEIISLQGYLDEEKVKIAEKYLVPKQAKKNGLANVPISFSRSVILELIRYYTKEAGVRSLERKIGSVYRKLARQVYEAQQSKPKNKKSYKVTVKSIESLIGPRDYKDLRTESKNLVGMTNGLAWTEVGGDLLPIEVSVVSGTGRLILTGQLGDVMKESCTAAMTYVRSRRQMLDFDEDFYAKHDVHVHVPEGAIPKDGPSAGIAIVTSIVSAFTGIPVKRTMAMTGEVTLRGRVLAIGGLKEKLMAAYRAGIKQVCIPMENEKSLLEVPKKVTDKIEIFLVDHVDQVLSKALNIKDSSKVFKNIAGKQLTPVSYVRIEPKAASEAVLSKVSRSVSK